MPKDRRLLRRAEALAYWLVVAPVAACLPAKLAYRVACVRGDWTFRNWPEKHAEMVRDMRQVLGDELTEHAAERTARELFRFRSCDVIDLMRLRGRARALSRLVEVRGRENLEAALAAGNGAILCTGHFGSHLSVLSLLHADGFPLTTIGRWDWNFDSAVSAPERRFWELVYARRVARHRQRPNIEPWPGRMQVAVQAAAVLRANEVVTICSDAAPLAVEQARAVKVSLLGREARLMPGVVTLARVTGAPILMTFVRRCADYRHQVLEISPPVPVAGEDTEVFTRCAAAIDDAIKANPAYWNFWFETANLVRLGLLPDGSAGREEFEPQLTNKHVG